MTCVGTVRLAVSPTPRQPYLFCPKASRAPPTVFTMVLLPPAATDVILHPPKMVPEPCFALGGHACWEATQGNGLIG